MLISLTVGKLDAGLAILLTEDKRLARAPLPRHARQIDLLGRRKRPLSAPLEQFQLFTGELEYLARFGFWR